MGSRTLQKCMFLIGETSTHMYLPSVRPYLITQYLKTRLMDFGKPYTIDGKDFYF